MKKNGVCIWEDHCLLNKVCPGGNNNDVCTFKNVFLEKLAKEKLPCLLLWPYKIDAICNLLPLREHTISICKCNNGKDCLLAKVIKNEFSQIFNDDTPNHASLMNRRLRDFFRKHPEILQEKIGMIEEMS